MVDSVNRIIMFENISDRIEIGPIMKKEFLDQFYEKVNHTNGIHP